MMNVYFSFSFFACYVNIDERKTQMVPAKVRHYYFIWCSLLSVSSAPIINIYFYMYIHEYMD